MSGRHGNRSGPEPYLSFEEERELASHLIKYAEIRYPTTKDEVIGIVRKALVKKRGAEFAEEFKEKGWWARFMTRWPALALRRGDALAVARAEAVTAANLKEYYDLLKTTLEEHGIMNEITKSSSISPTLAQTMLTPSMSRTPVTPKSSSISPTLAQTTLTPSVSHTPVAPKLSSTSPTLAQTTLTPSSSNRKPLSSLTGLLNFPTPPLTLTTKKENEKTVKWSHVLTSAEAIALLEKKARRKKEEEQAKKLRKKE